MRLTFAAACISLVPVVAAAQQSGRASADTARARRVDSVTSLPVTRVRASIVPTAGPAVGSWVPARTSTISGSEIRNWGPRILPGVLAQQPGVSVYDDLGSAWKLNVSTRGFAAGPTVGSPPGVTVFLDGVRQNEADAQEVNFDLLPLDAIDHIEFLSGTASLLGPNSLGGAINLVSVRGAGPLHGEIETSAGSFGAYRATAQASGRSDAGWSYTANGAIGTENGWRAATSDHAYNIFANAGREDDDRGVWFQILSSRSRGATAGSLPEALFHLTPRANFTPGDFEDLAARQAAISSYSPLLHGQAALTLYGRHSTAERFNVNQSPDPNVRGFTRNLSFGGTADWRWSEQLAGGTLAIRMGLDGVLNRVHLRIFNEEHSTANAADEADSEVLTTNVKSPSGNLAGYALADYRLGRTTLSGGLRDDYVRIPFQNLLNVEDRTTNSYSHLNPRFGASVDLGRGALAYASVGESFRAPAILELSCADPTAACPLPFALGDDPPLSPVVARTYEAGARWIGGSMLLSASLYRTDVRDEIFFVASEQTALSGYFRNLDRTRREGAEIAASGAAIDGRLEWFANYAYTRATFQSPAQLFSVRSEDDFRASPFAGQNDVMPGDRLPLVPAHQAKAGASFHGGRTSLGLDARYVGPQWLRGDEANETRPLGGFAIFDVRGSVDVRNWEIGATINNLFDMRRASFGTFNENRLTGDLERFFTPMSPRTVSVSLRRAFGAQEAR